MTRRENHESRRGFRGRGIELLEARMLLSLASEPVSYTAHDAMAPAPVVAHYSAQVSVVTPSSPPTSVSVSMLPAATNEHQAAVEALATQQVSANSNSSLSVLRRPAIFLRDQDGNLLSSLDGPPSTDAILIGDAPTTGDGSTPTPDQSAQDAQAKELTPEGLAMLPKVPWTLDYSVKGSLTSDRNWMSFKVPVGPSTSTLRLAVRPEHDAGEALAAMVDQMYLIGADGSVIAAVTGVSALSQGSTQTLVVSLQAAPAGGELVIRVIQPFAGPPAGSTDGADSTASTDGLGAITPSPFIAPNDFSVEIQRNDASPQTPGEATLPSELVLAPGSYLPASPDTAPPHIVGPATNSQTSGSLYLESSYASNTGLASYGSRVSIESVAIDSESSAISLGPLVSRGSAPMGPALATSIDDPAPSIRRDDQGGRDSAPERLGGEDAELVLELRLGGDAERTAGRRLDPEDVAAVDEESSPFTALKGLGGLPLLVASFRRNHGQPQADGLAATLRQETGSAVGPPPADDGLPVSSTDHRAKNEEVARAGIATRAIGFIIALGLASGPLYPDLVALARRRLARKRRAAATAVTTTNRRFFRRRSPWPVA